MNYKYYKVTVLAGHVGAGKSRDLILYIKAPDIITATEQAKKMPAVKHDKSVQYAEEITKEEYLEGRKTSAYNK